MHCQNEKRITIFTGHYGSGKTEISVNFAQLVRQDCPAVALVDLDFVNPYFRSREARDILNQQGIKVIASAEACFDTDLPAFSPQITGVLQNSELRVIVDLGGDELGARAIGRFRPQMANVDYEMCFVVNPYRPFTSSSKEIGEILTQIEGASRLPVTSLVSNPNLIRETRLSDIMDGHRMVVETAKELALPVKFIAVEQSWGDSQEVTGLGLPVLKLDRKMLVPWEN